MIDRSALEPWIQPIHLEEDTLAAYRQALSSHPARLVVLEDFLVEEKAGRLTRFLAEEAQFGSEHGLYSADGAVDEDAWLEADDDDRMFRLSRLAGIPPEYRLSPNALAYLQFRQSFQRPEFAAFFQAITGLELGPSDDFGVHAMRTGDFLRSHSDDVKNRRVALVIYLSPDWQPEFGGTLVVTDRDGSTARVDPGYNSMVVFDVLADTTHLVEPIRPDAGDRARFTIGGWYPNPA
jgi:2-oxoglutarate-Fe(II)-dependent oxygenase superfamily protein